MPEIAEFIDGPWDGAAQKATYAVIQVNDCLEGFYALYKDEITNRFKYQWVYKPNMTSV